MEHNKLANIVMEKLLQGNDTVLTILREQYKDARIVSEEYNNAGFYINYQISDAPIIPDEYNRTFQIGDLEGAVDNIDGAVGFVLFVKNGYIIMLEGYTNILDQWPESDSQIELQYSTGERDYVSLRKKWMKTN